MIINQASLNDLFVAYNAAFNTGFRDAVPLWQNVATRVPSGNRQNHYGWLGQFPQMREWIGDRHIKAMAAHDYTVVNKPFESTVEVDRDDLDDDQYGVYSPMMQEMGHAAATHPDELVFSLLKAGDSSLCYDGQYFFDVDHPVGGASVSNHGGGAGTPWYLLDGSRPLKPLIWQVRKEYTFTSMTTDTDEAVFMRKKFRFGVDARSNAGFGFWQQAYMSKQTLDATNFMAAYTAMESFISDEGRPLPIKPTHLVVPSALRSAAEALIQARTLASGADNVNYNRLALVVVNYLN